jgi:hypothetical protein
VARTAGDLEDRAAKFVVEQGLVLANIDFPVFNDMINRWCTKYKHLWSEEALTTAVLLPISR